MADYRNNFRCGYFQFKDFIVSPLWQDMLQEINNWEQKILQELSAPTFDASSGKMSMGKADRVMFDEMLRGNLDALEKVKQLPETIMEIIKQSSKETSNGHESD